MHGLVVVKEAGPIMIAVLRGDVNVAASIAAIRCALRSILQGDR
jgi:hypothetical protein